MRYLFLIIVFISTSYSQDSLDSNKGIGEKLKDDAFLYVENCGAFFLSPFSAGTEEFLYAAGITGGTILLMTQDQYIKKQVGRTTIKTLNADFWDIPTTYGIIGYANIFSFGMYAAGLFSGEDNLRTTGRLLVESITVSGISVMLFRYIAGRVRPYYNEGPWAYRWFETSNEIQSFPSGHTTVAFAISTILAEQIDTWWSRVFFYGFSSLTAFARVYNNQHWFSDVVAGGLLGFGSGMFIMNREHKREAGLFGSGISVLPGSNGLNFIYTFK
jgi:membrane-associated phospholipid phosphatase